MIKKNSKGVTFIEKILITVVMAILLAGSVEVYRAYRDQARVILARSTASYIISQSESFKANAGFFIPNLQEMKVSLEGVMGFAYSLNCRSGSGEGLYGKENSETCGSFDDKGLISNKTCQSDCNKADHSTNATNWMGVVLTHAYCGNPHDLPKLLTSGSSVLSDYQIKPTGSLQIPNLCEKAQEDNPSNIQITKTEKRDKKFQIKGSYGMCSSTRVTDKTQLRELSESCAHSKEYTFSSGYGSDIFSAERGAPDQGEDVFSKPNYLRIYAVGCFDQEDDCNEDHKLRVIYFDTRGVMGDYTLEETSS